MVGFLCFLHWIMQLNTVVAVLYQFSPDLHLLPAHRKQSQVYAKEGWWVTVD